MVWSENNILGLYVSSMGDSLDQYWKTYGLEQNRIYIRPNEVEVHVHLVDHASDQNVFLQGVSNIHPKCTSISNCKDAPTVRGTQAERLI